MTLRSIMDCYKIIDTVAALDGVRPCIKHPNGTVYRGNLKAMKPHGYGEKNVDDRAIFCGTWVHGKRDGFGMMRKRYKKTGKEDTLYVGQWKNDNKSGEGKQYLNDGSYYGQFHKNRRHGLGIKWNNDGSIYVGEWMVDHYHGLGVLFQANGNRYEGHFARGMKNGEGTFFHLHTGQLQKGVWNDDVCKSSMIMDEFRNQVDKPTPYPIQKVGIPNPDLFIHNLFNKYFQSGSKQSWSRTGLALYYYLYKNKKQIIFEPKHYFFGGDYIKCKCLLEPFVSLENQTPLPMRAPPETKLMKDVRRLREKDKGNYMLEELENQRFYHVCDAFYSNKPNPRTKKV